MHPALARLLFWRKKADRLREFAETEAFGARDLARAAERVDDPWLRRQLIRHAQDEVRHAALLGEDAAPASERALGGAVVGDTTSGESGIDIDRMGEVAFIAFVHEAEKRATAEFAMHREALGAEGELFTSILADEKRHVAWTGHQLQRWREAGRGAEVDAAVGRMRRQRWLNAWLWFARRLSLVMSTLILTGVFYVVLAPFTLLAGKRPRGWQGTPPNDLSREF